MDIKEQLKKFYEEDYSENDMEVMDAPTEETIEVSPRQKDFELNSIELNSDSFESSSKNYDYLNNVLPPERRSQLDLMFKDEAKTHEGELNIIEKASKGDADARDYLYIRMLPKVTRSMQHKFGKQFIAEESLSLGYDVYGICKSILNSKTIYEYFERDKNKGLSKYFIAQFAKRFGQILDDKLEQYASENYLDFTPSTYYNTKKGNINISDTATDVKSRIDDEDGDRNFSSLLSTPSFENKTAEKLTAEVLLDKIRDFLKKFNSESANSFLAYMDYKLEGYTDKDIAEKMNVSRPYVSKMRSWAIKRIRDEFSDVELSFD